MKRSGSREGLLTDERPPPVLPSGKLPNEFGMALTVD